MKRKVISGLVLALIFSLAAPAFAQTTISDVPVDHWAYHAVNTVVSKGYLTIFEDGTFQGTRAVDRYSLASVIARLLEDIEVTRVRGTTGDLTAIGDLRTRFEEDLATWYADQQGLRDSVKRVEENALVAEERVSRVVAAQVALQEELDNLRKEIQAQQAALTGLEGLIDAQSGETGSINTNLSEQGQRISELLNAVLVLEDEILRQGEEITRLENWMGEKDAVFAALQGADTDLSGQIDQLLKNNQQLEKDIQNLAVMLRGETQKREELAGQLEEAKAEIVVLREDRSMMEDVKQEVTADVNAQLNAALIREQRLERQIKTLEEDFNAYKTNAEKEMKSAKTMAIVGIAIGAIGAVIGFMGIGGN